MSGPFVKNTRFVQKSTTSCSQTFGGFNTCKAVQPANTCGMSVEELFQSHPIYNYRSGIYKVNLGDESEPPTWLSQEPRDSYAQGEKVIYIEDGGREYTLYEALEPITEYFAIIDTTKWNKVCSISTSVAAFDLLLSVDEIQNHPKHKKYFLTDFNLKTAIASLGLEDFTAGDSRPQVSFFTLNENSIDKSLLQEVELSQSASLDTFSFFYNKAIKGEDYTKVSESELLNLPEPLPETFKAYYYTGSLNLSSLVPLDLPDNYPIWFSTINTLGDFYYRVGDLVWVESPCADAICIFQAKKDIPATEEIFTKYSEFKFNVSFKEYWDKVYCVCTGVNKCVKDPCSPGSANIAKLGYLPVKLGDRGHCIEIPTPYSIGGPCLNKDLGELARCELPVYLKSREISGLNPPL